MFVFPLFLSFSPSLSPPCLPPSPSFSLPLPFFLLSHLYFLLLIRPRSSFLLLFSFHILPSSLLVIGFFLRRVGLSPPRKEVPSLACIIHSLSPFFHLYPTAPFSILDYYY